MPAISPAILLFLFVASSVVAQTSGISNSSIAPNSGNTSLNAPVPALVEFSTTLLGLDSHELVGPQNIKFAIYKDQSDDSPLWSETQSVSVDGHGHFTVLLGANSPDGFSLDSVTFGAARWMGITPEDGIERNRTLLTSVPYAVKASDAATLQGIVATDFVTQEQLSQLIGKGSAGPGQLAHPFPMMLSVVQKATAFEATTPVGPSFISTAGAGPPFQVASQTLVGNLNAQFLEGLDASAFAQLESSNMFTAVQQFNGGLSLLPPSLAQNILPHISAPLDFIAATIANGTLQNYKFRWQAEPTSIVGTNGATLNLLFGSNSNPVSETGLSINADGSINFADNQQFPASVLQTRTGGSIGTTSTDPAVQPTVYASLYTWQQQPTKGTIQIGSDVITLSPCPHGVNGTDAWHFLYISGTGTPEVVLITGGTCTSGAKTGTIQFQAAETHSAGFIIGTATGGLQEALTDALVPGTGAGSTSTSIARPVVINPGEYLLRARLSVRTSNQTISASGATLDCSMSDTCVMLGDPANTNTFNHVTISNLTMRPAVVNGVYSALEDNSNASKISAIVLVPGVTGKETFGHLIQVDNDQNADLEQINTNGQRGLLCNATFCGSVIYAPGPFSVNAAVGSIKNSNMNLQCVSNGVDWQSGNTVSITDSNIQGYPQFGVRAGLSSGGYGNVQMTNLYEEVGGCTNPVGNIGEAGVIVNGGPAFWSGGQGPAGIMPQFANSGTNRWNYYVVPQSSLYGPGNPLYAGFALTDNITPVTVTAPDVPGAVTFDLLKVSPPTVEGQLQHAPNGVMATPSEGAVVLAVARESVCSNGMCTFIDNTNATPGPYTVASVPTYFPKLNFWPGTAILGAIADGNSLTSTSTLNLNVDYSLGQSMNVNSVMGPNGPSIIATECPDANLGSPVWVSCTSDSLPPGTDYQQESLLLPNQNPNDSGVLAVANLKGRLNFMSGGYEPGHIITLVDSNIDKTIATNHNRPPNDPGDSFIGTDQFGYGGTGITIGASLSLSEYIGNIGDNKNWLERLTAASKTFNVPVTINGNLILNGTCTGCNSTGGAVNTNTNRATLIRANVGESAFGFDASGRLAVSENAGPVREIAKRTPQQFAYLLSDFSGSLSASQRSPSVYINRASPLHILEIYCEADSGNAVINLQSKGSLILASNLQCATDGSSSSTFNPGTDTVTVGARIDHVTVSAGPDLHRLNVVVKYLPD